MSRAALLDSYLIRSCALVLAFFRRQNGRAFFPPPPIAARLPRRCAGQTQMAALGMFRVAGVVSQREETGLFFFCV